MYLSRLLDQMTTYKMADEMPWNLAALRIYYVIHIKISNVDYIAVS